jgi:hypothetical protein
MTNVVAFTGCTHDFFDFLLLFLFYSLHKPFFHLDSILCSRRSNHTNGQKTNRQMII